MSLRSPNGALGVLIDGYDYIGRRCNRAGGDVFETRLLGKPVTFLRGTEAGRVFYDETRFARTGVAPAAPAAPCSGRAASKASMTTPTAIARRCSSPS